MAVEELVGHIPDGWTYTTLGKACADGGGDIQTGPFGSQLHAADYVPVGVPSIMPQNIGDNRISEYGIARITPEDATRLSRYLVREGDIVYSRRGDVEKRALIRANEDGWLCGTGCLRVRLGDKGANPSYAAYYLGHPSVREWIVRHAHGATMPNLNTSILSSCPFVIPPPAEQRAIAHILGTLDDKIELNRRRNQTLEAMARALFKDWFVDFGPVRAKMEGRDPYLPADLWQIFPDRLDDEGKPEGWQSATLANFANLNPESWTKKHPPHEIRYVDLSNTKQGTIEGAARMPWSEAPSRAQRILRIGDTIVGTVRPGNESFALISEDGMTGSTGFAVLRPQEKYFRDFVFLAATSPENIERLSHLADGAAYPAVRPDVVLASPVTVPSGEIVNDVLCGFANAVSGLVDAIERNKQESRTLTQIRETLLPKLISGELRIAEAERFLARAGALDRAEITAT